jgi:hypothetical protein
MFQINVYGILALVAVLLSWALASGGVSDKERTLLAVLRDSLGISAAQFPAV